MKFNVDAAQFRNKYSFTAEFYINNKCLLKYIHMKKFCYALHIECAVTRYRNLFKSFSRKMLFNILSDKLDGKVEVCPMIISAEHVNSYRNEMFNPDYGDITFIIKKGDILAVDRNIVFSADKKIDPLRKISSIFTIGLNRSPNAPPIDIDAMGNRVVVLMNKENFERYRILKLDQNMHSTLACVTAFPALISLLETLKSNIQEDEARIGDYEGLRWFRVISNKLNELGVNVHDGDLLNESSLKIAQELIGNQLTGSLKNLEGYITDF
ncbi:MAG: hypothetical protein GX318_03755 [Clostridia bacterium]|nr:hypothetical protein [Clostridia bacterium]